MNVADQLASARRKCKHLLIHLFKMVRQQRVYKCSVRVHIIVCVIIYLALLLWLWLVISLIYMYI